jgi:hypothetical protein
VATASDEEITFELTGPDPEKPRLWVVLTKHAVTFAGVKNAQMSLPQVFKLR